MLPLYLAMATAAGFVDFRVRPAINADYVLTDYVPSVLNNTAPPPARYRVLGPHVFAALERWTNLEAHDAWIVFRWLCLFGALVAGHVLFRTWFDAGGAVAGNALMVVLLWLTFTGGYGHPDHLLELFLFTLGCGCVARGWNAGFIAVLAASALNRETSAFLLPLFLFVRGFDRRHLTWTAVAAFVWLGLTLALRWRLGWVPYDPLNVEKNLAWMSSFPVERDLYYRIFAWFFLILAVPALLTIGSSWPRQPRFTRVAAGIVAPALILTGFLFSSVSESRIFTPLLPLLVPGLLFAVFPAEPRP